MAALIRVTVEQRCLAAQALWAAANRMLDERIPKAIEWYNCIGYDEMRYRCRCKYNVEAYYDAKALMPDSYASTPEEVAWVVLRVCFSKKSMNVNRDWKSFLMKDIEKWEQKISQQEK